MAKTERKRTSATATEPRRVKSAERLAVEATGIERTQVKAARRGAAGPARASSAQGGAAHKKKALPSEVSRAVRAALDKKAQDVVVLDLRNTPAFTDFFILSSGLNQRQVKAIADAVDEALRAAKLRPAHTEGYDRADWILMDYFNFIVHVFSPEMRLFYSLDRLWGDAERIEVSDEPPTAAKTAKAPRASKTAKAAKA